MNKITSTKAHLVAALFFLSYLASLTYQDSFLMAILFYLPATILTLVGILAFYVQHKDKKILMAAYGLGLSLIAPLAQQFRISLHPIYLTYNSLYHIILMAALLLFFIGVRKIVLIGKAQQTTDAQGKIFARPYQL